MIFRSSFYRLDNLSKTPSSMDTQLESDISTSTPSSSNHLQLPPTDTTHRYPRRDTTSSHSRSTLSSLAKSKVRVRVYVLSCKKNFFFSL